MMNALKLLALLAILTSGLVGQPPSRTLDEMTPATVYKALAERMLVAADQTTDRTRRAELLDNADAAMKSFELARQREDRQGQPRAMGERIQHMTAALSRIAESIQKASEGIRERLKSPPEDAPAREDLKLEVSAMVNRARRTLALVEEGVENLRSERNLLLELFVEHPELKEARTFASSLEYLGQAEDCAGAIVLEIERLALASKALEGGSGAPVDR